MISCREQSGDYADNQTLIHRFNNIQHGGALTVEQIISKYQKQFDERVSQDPTYDGKSITDILNDKHYKKYFEWIIKSYIDKGYRH